MSVEIISGKEMTGKSTKLFNKVAEWTKEDKVLLFWLDEGVSSLECRFGKMGKKRRNKISIFTYANKIGDIDLIIRDSKAVSNITKVAIDSLMMIDGENIIDRLEKLAVELNLKIVITKSM